MGYSYIFNRTLYDFQVNGKKIYGHTYAEIKSSPDEVRKIIEKYLFKKVKIIDLSNDTWFNQYLIRIP